MYELILINVSFYIFYLNCMCVQTLGIEPRSTMLLYVPGLFVCLLFRDKVSLRHSVTQAGLRLVNLLPQPPGMLRL